MNKFSRSSVRAAIALVGASLLVGGFAVPASATEAPVTSRAALVAPGNQVPTGLGVITQRKVVSHSKTTNYVDKSRKIAYCNVATTGLSCSINRTASATRTIQVSLGASKDFIASSLGFSSASSVSVGVTCSSGKLKKGQSLVAYSVGSRHKYKVNKIDARSGIILSNQTSGWLYAFNPYKAGISCQVV